MKNNNEIKYVLTNEKTMRKVIIPNGCYVCHNVDKDENPNKFEFNGVVMCPKCGTIYVPYDNKRLVSKVINSGNSFAKYLTDGPSQDDLGVDVEYIARPKRRVLTPANNASKLHSTK